MESQALDLEMQPFVARGGGLACVAAYGDGRLKEVSGVNGFEGFHQMMDVMQRLVDKGNSIICIEHNLDVIRCSDWIIDLGPEGGDKGGELLVTGTPEEVAQHPTSHTGRYLNRVLDHHPPQIPLIAA